ncbi:Mbov_0396 family ICE element transmembrane protein [Spiroplasma endosymbiont of Lasioglossum malachurum]|uniref:Mbov_0396 family ICE element transmembrane protein n=1 Tax=Spiroplasma endosymbiont of Lasioglossum malachurum TaxID=3066319 RepID=UPI0030D19495
MDWLTDIILGALLFIPWLIFIQGPLYLIDILLRSPNHGHGGIFDYLTTDAITNLVFGDFTKVPLNSKNLPLFFSALAIVSIGVILIMFIMQLIIIQFTETHTIREKLGKAIKNTFLAFLVIVFIPFFMSTINYLITGLLAVLQITALGKNASLADLLWGIGAPDANAAQHDPGVYSMPPISQLKHWNFILEIIAVWFTLYVLFVASMTLVERIIDLLLLFSISPIVASMMPVDQGKRLGVWKEMVIGKFIIGPGTMLPIYIFLQILPKAILDITNNTNFSWLEKQVLYTLFCTAGAISCLRTQKIINHLVTQNLGVQSAIDSNGAAIAGNIMGKARTFASLAAGGAGALKLGKQIAFGGAKDGRNPDGSQKKANGLLKNGITGYLGKGTKGIAKGIGKFQNSHDQGTKWQDTKNNLKSPFVGLNNMAKGAFVEPFVNLNNTRKNARRGDPDE